jgi:hypothetical protein
MLQAKLTGFLLVVLIGAFGAATAISASQSYRRFRESGLEQMNVLFQSLSAGMELLIQKGEMNDFETLLARLATIPGVEEIGLTGSQGMVDHSTRPQALQRRLESSLFRSAVSAKGNPPTRRT